MLRRGMTSGYRVAESIMVSKYWFPRLLLGNGPTQSIITLQKDSSITGIGWRGAGLIPVPDLPVT